MANVQTPATHVQPALLFMPDISGFTQFVNNTEIIHSQHIIRELLEIMINSNQLGLEVGEIEGDAVFFFRIGDKPSLEQLLEQVQVMFTKFHQHLQLYEKQRICNCGACTSAVNLTLKIIAHFGEVTDFSVKEHRNIFGRDVILLHRLLKNNLEKNQYVLFTDALVKEQPSAELPGWFKPETSAEIYDVGEVNFLVADLTPLHAVIPPINIPETNLAAKTFVALGEEAVLDASQSSIFRAIMDIPQRVQWRDGIKGIEMVTGDYIHRIGTQHRCILSEKDKLVMTSESLKITGNTMELVEMEIKGEAGNRFIIEKIAENRSRVVIQLLLKNNLLMKIILPFIKKKMSRQFRNSLSKLASYCKTGSN